MKKKIFLPLSLIAMSFPVALSQNYRGHDALYISDFTDRKEYVAHALKVNEQIANEGMVLLKNDGFLPFKNVKKISLVGKASYQPMYAAGARASNGVGADVKLTQMKDAFIAGGFTLNEELETFYNTNRLSGPGRSNGNGGWRGNSEVQIGETPLSCYTPELLASMDQYNDAAIMVITREGAEGVDVKTNDARDFDPRVSRSMPDGVEYDGLSNRHALQLSKNEEDLLNELHKHFNHIVVLLNTANVFECDVFENDPKVSAVLWTGYFGESGATSIVNVLTGKVNPSGRTVDTWARDFREDPTYQNFSDNAQTSGKIYQANWGKKPTNTYVPQDTMFTSDGYPVMSFGTDKLYNDHAAPRWEDEPNKIVSGGINGVKPSAYVSYEEDIYRDYRYYETKYADLKASNSSKADKWYKGKQGVTYPFGYGLSYTKFEHKIVSSNYANNSNITDKTKLIEITVRVKNTGHVAGKDVVQAYWKAPYYKGQIEKPYEVLCAFGKTGVLKPNESQDVKLSFFLQDVASYDYKDKNNNGFKGYELDKGTYYVSINKNAHEQIASIKLNLKNGITYEKDRFTGATVENRFSNNDFNNSLPTENDVEFTLMRRDDMDNTFPTHPTIASRTLGAKSKVEDYLTHPFDIAEVDVLDTDYYSLKEARITKQIAIDKGWKQEKPEKYQMIDTMRGVDLDDPKWETFLNQLTYGELRNLTTGYMMGSRSLTSIQKKAVNAGTGITVRFASNDILSATYNVELAKAKGNCYAIECMQNKKMAIWNEDASLRRSPFGGRNYHFYSSDPFLAGKMVATFVREIVDKGIVAFVSGFIAANQEKNREGLITYVSEQALRELEMKPFQMAVEEGKANCIQTGFNRLGLVDVKSSYPLLMKVLRGEWGFKGSVVTDMHHAGNTSFDNNYYENPNASIIGGSNGLLDQSSGLYDYEECKWDETAFDGKGCPTFEYKGKTYESYSWWGAMRRAAKEELYIYVNSYIPISEMIQSFETIVTSEDNIEAYLNEDVEVTVSSGGGTLSIDKETPLPNGLTFKDGKISGKPTKEGSYTVNILLEDNANEGYVGGKVIRFEILPAKEGAKKAGCGGSILATSVVVGTITLLSIGLIFLKKKKEVQA